MTKELDKVMLTDEEISDAKADAILVWVKGKKLGLTPRDIAENWDSTEITKLMNEAIAKAAVAKAIPIIAEEITFDDEDVHIFDTSYGYNQVRIDHVFLNEGSILWQILKERYQGEKK